MRLERRLQGGEDAEFRQVACGALHGRDHQQRDVLRLHDDGVGRDILVRERIRADRVADYRRAGQRHELRIEIVRAQTAAQRRAARERCELADQADDGHHAAQRVRDETAVQDNRRDLKCEVIRRSERRGDGIGERHVTYPLRWPAPRRARTSSS
ncbi:conserved hypothetical protein [Ricinus communis]|uniref:Uncharacterized protein n=1 Tax=Ricinus communis TaxID=3988 RepID=B9TAQ0_RICCO|nr:conserved hypothetical protein [Ricinus communis]